MTSGRNLRLIDVDRLADECRDQTARFFSRTEHDTGYCYELFRRAIVDRNNYAWEKIYQIYDPLVASWVRHHSGLEATDEEVDYFVNCAFDKMWTAVDREKFAQFQSLASLLRYFQTCVHSVIVDYARGNRIKTTDLDTVANLPSPDSPSIEKYVTDELERHRLWGIVSRLTRDDREIMVLRYSFVYDLKPAQIYAANPDQFENLEELYRIKRNILNRLGRNEVLRQFLQ
jgi:DNA-directed RNA polymerase specialized sigma24 family protein